MLMMKTKTSGPPCMMGFGCFLVIYVVFTMAPSITSAIKHFRGGSTSYQVLDFSDNSTYLVRLIVITGWKLGEGPCGPGCTIANIGDVTRQRRLQVTTNNPNYFGSWTIEIPNQNVNLQPTFRPVTGLVNQNITGRITAVNVPLKWVQEIAEFYVSIDATREYYDIVLKGDSWMDVDLQSKICKPNNVSHRCNFHLQQKLYSGIRNDTKTPNNSPLVMFKPIYRVKLNEETQIPLTATDKDGDKTTCREARWIELDNLSTMRGTQVTEECVVIVKAYEKDNFNDGDWGIVNLIVDERPPHAVSLGARNYKALDSIGVTQVQFLVQTVKNLTVPEFTAPTSCVTNAGMRVARFFVYAGSTLRIPLYAKPSPTALSNIEIDSFQVTTIPDPSKTVSVTKPARIAVSDPERKFLSSLTWHVSDQDKGHYILQVLAVDSDGYDSIDCSFDVEVKELNSTHLVEASTYGGPFFPFFPDANSIKCFKDAECTVPIFIQSNFSGAVVTDIRIVNSSQSLTLKHKMVGEVTFKGAKVYQLDVTLSSSVIGQKSVCFEAHDSLGSTTTECLDVDLFGPDPCTALKEPCNKGDCFKHPNDTSKFFCVCDALHTGEFCETNWTPCDRGYCGANSAQCYYVPGMDTLCICNPGYTGKQCEHKKPSMRHIMMTKQ